MRIVVGGRPTTRESTPRGSPATAAGGGVVAGSRRPRAGLLRASLVVAVSFFAVGCSEPLVFDDWTIPVPEGATVIGHEHVPIEERTERIELVEDLVIGGGEDPNARFYRAWGMAVDEAGNIYVLDSGNHRVQVFDEQGDYVRTLGSEGQGPGEIQESYNVTIAGDVVVLVDSANARINRWSTIDGEYLGAAPLEERSLELHGLADGAAVGTHVIFHREPEFWRERLYGHFSLEGEVLQQYTVMRLFGEACVCVPYVYERMATTPAGDVYITRTDRYQVLAFDAGGAPRWALRTSYVTPEVPAEIHDEALRLLREREPDYERPDSWIERMPAIANLAVDGDGNLYVFHYVFTPRHPYTGQPLDSAQRPDEYAVDVYSPEGERLATALSDHTGWTAAHGDHVYSMGRDPETEEEVLRRYRLVRPWQQ